MSGNSSPGHEELIIDLSDNVTSGQEGGIILSREAGNSDVEGSLRYRASSGGTTGATSESPSTFGEDFIEVQVRPRLAPKIYKLHINYCYLS